MSDIKLLLKYFQKLGYPNPNVLEIMESMNYSEDTFLSDLVDYLGQDGAEIFVQKTIEKMSTPEGIKIELDEDGLPNSYVYLKIGEFIIDLDQLEYSIGIKGDFTGGKIIEPESQDSFTMEEFWEELDLVGQTEFSDVLESCTDKHFRRNTGFFATFL